MRINLNGIHLKNGNLFNLVLKTKEIENEDIVTIEAIFDDTIITVQEEYYFTALQKLRKQLFKQGFDICCYGAKKNVYPSPMMMNSSKAYLLKTGRQAKADDIVDIFTPCNLGEITTVEEQNLFYQEWIQSLK